MPKKKLNHNNNTFKKRWEKQSPVLINISRGKQKTKQKSKTEGAKGKIHCILYILKKVLIIILIPYVLLCPRIEHF